MKKNLLVLFGGKSNEYAVSLMSVCTVLAALDGEKYNVTAVGITRDGVWYHYDGDPAHIRDNTWCMDTDRLRRAMLSPSCGDRTLYIETETENTFRTVPVDVVLPVMHGAYSEDGTMQGLLSMSGIPYVGPHCAASAVGMDKAFTKAVLAGYGIPQAKCAVLSALALHEDLPSAVKTAEAVSPYPLFVKPANAGSSVGASKARDRAELERALLLAAGYDKKVLVEECLIGREVECAVLGNDHPVAAVPGEIAPGADFYDYDTKYVTDTSEAFIPARIQPETLEKIRSYAVTVFSALGCRGLSRVDFFVCPQTDGTERIVFNEINTLPGFTKISMYPKLWEHMGTPIPALLDKLIALAEEADE